MKFNFLILKTVIENFIKNKEMKIEMWVLLLFYALTILVITRDAVASLNLSKVTPSGTNEAGIHGFSPEFEFEGPKDKPIVVVCKAAGVPVKILSKWIIR